MGPYLQIGVRQQTKDICSSRMQIYRQMLSLLIQQSQNLRIYFLHFLLVQSADHTPRRPTFACPQQTYHLCSIKRIPQKSPQFSYVFYRRFLFETISICQVEQTNFSAIAPRELSLTSECSCHFLQHHPQFSSPLLVQFFRFLAPFRHQIDQTTAQARLKGGSKQKGLHHILCATKFKVHFHIFLKSQQGQDVVQQYNCG